MKKTILGICILAVGLSAQAQKSAAKPAAKPVTKTAAKPATKAAAKPATTFALKTNNDSLSYALGISIGSFLLSQDVKTFNYTALNKAIQQVLAKQPTVMDGNTANQFMGQMAEAKRGKALGEEKKKGDAFFAENKKKSGVVETASGLQYEIITKGSGEVPTSADTVVAHYRGTLLNGKEFDNSYSRGEPITIPVTGVIAGWTEALQLMPVGSKWKLYIPAGLGYGDYGAGQDIPGGAALVFEVELVDIKNRPSR